MSTRPRHRASRQHCQALSTPTADHSTTADHSRDRCHCSQRLVALARARSNCTAWPHGWMGHLALLLMCSLVSQRAAARVVNGQAATTQDYPFVAAILVCKRAPQGSKALSGAYCSQICTGSVVTPGAVLTAASCIWLPADRSPALSGTQQCRTAGRGRVLGPPPAQQGGRAPVFIWIQVKAEVGRH